MNRYGFAERHQRLVRKVTRGLSSVTKEKQRMPYAASTCIYVFQESYCVICVATDI
jgi:hypothetical protein